MHKAGDWFERDIHQATCLALLTLRRSCDGMELLFFCWRRLLGAEKTLAGAVEVFHHTIITFWWLRWKRSARNIRRLHFLFRQPKIPALLEHTHETSEACLATSNHWYLSWSGKTLIICVSACTSSSQHSCLRAFISEQLQEDVKGIIVSHGITMKSGNPKAPNPIDGPLMLHGMLTL